MGSDRCRHCTVWTLVDPRCDRRRGSTTSFYLALLDDGKLYLVFIKDGTFLWFIIFPCAFVVDIEAIAGFVIPFQYPMSRPFAIFKPSSIPQVMIEKVHR